MDSGNPNCPEGQYGQQSDQPSGGSSQERQPSQPYSAPPPPPSTPQQGDVGPQGGYGQSQSQYSDRPASQPPPQYGDRPAAPQQGGYTPQHSDQPQYQQPQQPYYGPPPSQVNVAPKKSNNGMLYGLIGLVVLALVGAGLWFFVINKSGGNPLSPIIGGGSSAFSEREAASANALPQNTVGYISIATNLEGSQKAAFDKMREAFEAQPGVKEAIDQMTKQATGGGGQSSEMVQEIQSLISKYTKQISIAVLPPSTTDWQAIQSGGQTAIMDVVSRNVVAIADMDLARLKADATSSEAAETYKDVEISRIVSGTITLYAAPLGGSNVAVGILRPESVRSLIDQVKDGKPTIRDDDTYKFLSGSVPADRVASFYLNLSEIYKQVEAVAPGQLAKSGVESMSGGVLMTVSGQDDGLQVDFATQADVKTSYSAPINITSKPDASTLNDLPADTTAFLVSTDLRTLIKTTLDSMSAASKRAGTTDFAAQAEQQVQQATGLSLQNDILPIMGGDYALSAAAGNDGRIPATSTVFQMKLNGGDRDKAVNVVDKLMQAVGRGQAPPTFDAAGGKFYDLSSLMGGSNLGLVAGVGSDRFMVVYTPDQNTKAKLEEVANNFGKGFGTSADWDVARKHLPNDSNAIIYVNIEKLRPLFESGMSSEARGFMAPFKYLVVGSANSAPNRGVMRLFLGISK